MFWEIFSKLCDDKKIKPNPLGKELGISSGSITNWKNGKLPNGENLLKLANYFNVSVDYLLTGNNPNANIFPDTNMELSYNEKEMLMLFAQISDRDQVKIIGQLEHIVAENGKYKSKETG